MPRWATVVLGLVALALATGAGCGIGFLAGAGVTGGLSFSRNGVAVVRVVGTIQTGEGNGLFAADGAYSGRITSELRRAQRDPAVKAVVLQVDSPGGGVTASDEIRNEVLRTRTGSHKPVVVSMGSMAASGGYYVSAPADRIVANPTTLTGSIGVITVLTNMQGLLDKVGITTEVLTTGAHKDDTSGLRPLTAEDRHILQTVIDDAFDRFVSVVAEGRRMDPARVRELADGRIYSGNQAKDLGLVDDFGDLPEALRTAADLGGVNGPYRIIEYRRGFGLSLGGLTGLFRMAGSGNASAALGRESPGLMNYLYVVP